MSTGSSGCVFNNFTQLFTCEKRCDSVEARKALLEEFTSKVYRAEVGYVGSDGNIASEEQYSISFRSSRNQKDDTLKTIHGAAILRKKEDTPKNLTWTGIYLASGYRMKVRGENFEKEFNLNCGSNDKINFLIKKTDSGSLESWVGVGNMSATNPNCSFDKCVQSYSESWCENYYCSYY